MAETFALARSQRSVSKPDFLRATKRRVAGIGGVVPRPEESLPRAPVLAVPLPWAPGRLWPRLNAYVTADSKQNSAAEYDATISHSTRSPGPGTRVGWSPRVVPQTDFARGIAAR